ncbi:hypothetical protein HPB49_005481 [Dermacentor silvarum]|uniref:Uncharacterized protein n=1 Tax=Dermacentor silvarum TaxID=543639 RepID=A0ACB8DWD6_DERSI|nr:hypothetical protein HPB49_005481 [Dermacentor silvarum]
MKNAQHLGLNVKQAKTATHVKLEEVLLTWFGEVTAAGVNVDGKVLSEQADNIALSLRIEISKLPGDGCIVLKKGMDLSTESFAVKERKWISQLSATG